MAPSCTAVCPSRLRVKTRESTKEASAIRKTKGSRVSKRSKKEDKSKKRKRERVSSSGGLFDYDPRLVEPPLVEDFEGSFGLNRENYVWGPPPPKDEVEEVIKNPRFPRIPELEESSESDEQDGRALDGPQCQILQTEQQNRKSRFLRLPLEIRNEVYRYILVADRPIPVYSGWRHVYERQRPGLCTSVLRIIKQIYDEAIEILYGENTFLYRLRDPPPNRPQNESESEAGSADDQETSPQRACEDGDFIPEETPYRAQKTAAAPGNCPARKDIGKSNEIDIAKFGWMLRYLIIEAERNRYSHETQQLMAQAINVFTAEPGNMIKASRKGGISMVRKLTLRVAPLRQCSADGDEGFTFANFFGRESPVLHAMHALYCKDILVDISTQHFANDGGKRISRMRLDTSFLHSHTSDLAIGDHVIADILARTAAQLPKECMRRRPDDRSCGSREWERQKVLYHLSHLEDYFVGACQSRVEDTHGLHEELYDETD